MGFSLGTTTPLGWADIFADIGRQLGFPNITGLPEQERVRQLTVLLSNHKTLLIMDNLESAVQNQDELVFALTPLLKYSKALLTSRHRFNGDLYPIHLKGLDDENALLLIRAEAQEKGVKRVAEARSGDLRAIARDTGNSPLAIKLTVGQLHHLPMDQVLRSLKLAGIGAAIDSKDEYVRFYKGIFLNSWKLLSIDAQKLLISMAVFAPGIGGTFDAIGKTSGLDQDILIQKIDELWRLSFLETGESSVRHSRYYLHPLTQYFVVSDIINPPKKQPDRMPR
jgi:hypothetical protein